MKPHRYYWRPILWLAGCSMSFPAAQAAINLDRTRVIFDSTEPMATVTLINQNGKSPYLAQSWLTDESHNKISSPFTVLPPLQRLEAGGRSLIRLVKTAGVEQLPQDRESIFYLNVREIPPKPEKANVLQIAVQSEIKVFYRPEKIKPGKSEIWQKNLRIRKAGAQFIVENPTPYFITVSTILRQPKQNGDTPVRLLNDNAFMIAPKSEMNINVLDPAVKDFYLYYVNDYGGHPELHFSCRQNLCLAEQKS
ncbi:molecular chaperone [Affinibrenneria salicis]|uniref:Molecular chaperone n=1 Tax=Affinibrenneria salicis TaxID=2590031 RepID=A0A5J5FVG1_9GAMM|nr:molecular chaperone [Affinibrenneria salicis]KAA8997633.1 molecular chaperone [Affinibrenneria salicis]